MGETFENEKRQHNFPPQQVSTRARATPQPTTTRTLFTTTARASIRNGLFESGGRGEL